MHVIATAGHVDHGKSTLVRALTGMEPDRWPEERERGMTIDLGYAWTRLPSGNQVAFVDVPGHERFATNMLAGVGPVPAALLVIAADGGWAAQTEDHVRALHALGVSHGVVAVTRSDLADPWPAATEAGERLRRTSLAGIPVIAVSGATGAGLDELRAAIDALATSLTPPDPEARVRLWVDRCFTIRGIGTVVTGTLPAGTVHRGDHLEVNGRTVAVRTLQCLGEPVREASGVARVALNLRGVAQQDMGRGDALLAVESWLSTRVVDVRTADGDLPSHVVVHVGSAAVPATVRALPGGGPVAGAMWGSARLHLHKPLPLEVGDRLLLRDPGRRAILGGAIVLDPAPPALHRRGAARRRATALADDTGVPNLERELARRGAAGIDLLRGIGVVIPAPLPPGVVPSARLLVEGATWERWKTELREAVRHHRAGTLLDSGIGRSDLVLTLNLPDVAVVTDLVAACDDLEEAAGRVRRRGTAASLRPDVAAAVVRLATSLDAEPFLAPDQPELVALGLGRRELGAAAAAGAILRLRGDVVLLPDAPDRAVARLAGIPQPFTLSAARQALGTTRRVAVPLLEHLDAMRVTERVSTELRRLRP